jgi:hypothetical protein
MESKEKDLRMQKPNLNDVIGPFTKGSEDALAGTSTNKDWRPGTAHSDTEDSEQMASGGDSADEVEVDIESIQPGLKVLSKTSDEEAEDEEEHIGTVDHMDGERYIKLTKSDSSDGKHHWIPVSWVERIEDGAVYLNKDAEEVTSSMFHSLPSESNN